LSIKSDTENEHFMNKEKVENEQFLKDLFDDPKDNSDEIIVKQLDIPYNPNLINKSPKNDNKTDIRPFKISEDMGLKNNMDGTDDFSLIDNTSLQELGFPRNIGNIGREEHHDTTYDNI